MRKSLVLLKNGKPGEMALLPLPKNADRILVAGSHAHNLGYQCGGWTITWQGKSGNTLTTGNQFSHIFTTHTYYTSGANDGYLFYYQVTQFWML